MTDDPGRPPNISDRNWERYALVVREGHSARETARRLGVSVGAVSQSVLRVEAQIASWRRRRDDTGDVL